MIQASDLSRKPYPWYVSVERFNIGNYLFFSAAVAAGNLAAQWWQDASRFNWSFTLTLIGFSFLGVGIAYLLRHFLLILERRRRGLSDTNNLVGVVVAFGKRGVGEDEGTLEFAEEQVHFRGTAMDFSLLSTPEVKASFKGSNSVLIQAGDAEWRIAIHGAGKELLNELKTRIADSTATTSLLPPTSLSR